MSSSLDLNGPIDAVFEAAQAHVLAQMPRDHQGHAIDRAKITLDQDRRLAIFEWGSVRAVADAQVVGLYLESQDQPGLVAWRWGWSVELFRDELLQHVMALKKWGDGRRIPETENIELIGHRERFWGFAMICAVINGAAGVVGLPRSDAMVILTIGSLRAG